MALKFTEDKSPLLSNTYRDFIDTERVNKLLTLDFTEKFGISSEIAITLKNTLRRFRDLVNNNGYFEVSYNQPDKIGRIYPKGANSVSQILREVRHTLLQDYYIDFDIVCAQPSILKEFCLKHNIPCKFLAEYIENRDDKVNEMIELFSCNRDEAKGLFNSLTNGGSFKGWLDKIGLDKDITKPKYIELYEEQILTIREEIKKANLTLWNKFYKKISKDEDYNIDGKVFSRFLQDLERQCLEAMVLPELKYKDKYYISLCHDGLLVLNDTLVKNQLTEEQLCNLMEDSVKAKLGFNIKVIVKPFDKAIDIDEIQLEDVLGPRTSNTPQSGDGEESESETNSNQIRVNNDIEGCEFIYNEIKKANCIIYGGDNTYYVKNGNIWENNDKLVNKIIRNFISQFDIVINNGVDKKGNVKTKQFSKKLSEIPRIVDQTLSFLVKNQDVKFTDKFRNTTLGKICFDNGVLDFKTREFKLWADCPDVYTRQTTGRDYVKCDNIELQNKIKNDIFKNTFGENDYLRAIHFFSRAMAGHTSDKVWGLLVASRDIGKSVFINYLKNAFGSKYITIINSSSLLESNDSQDADKANQWMFALEHARITFSSEAKTSKQKMDGMKIKQISSGYDSISARHMMKEAISFRPSSILFMMANDIGRINTEDAFKNVCSFSNNKSFVTEIEINARREQGASNEELDTYLIKDDKIESKINSNEYINALFEILLEGYNENPIDKVNVFTESEGKIENLHTFFEKYITFTKNENDFVSVKEIEKLCDEININYKMKLRPYLKDVRKCNCDAQKRVKGMKYKGISGIKLVIEETPQDILEEEVEIAALAPYKKEKTI
jgi:hypothetical protein